MRIPTLCLAALATAATALPASAEVFGTWLTENKKAIVEIAPCAASACGYIVWMAEPLDTAGQPKVDANNPNPAMKGRPVCGMPMVGSFVKDAAGEWSDGFIYDPEGGDEYKSKMRVTEEGNLYVRGYVGIPLLGKSQIWTRVADNRGGC